MKRNVVIVKALPAGTSNEDLRKIFAAYGAVHSIELQNGGVATPIATNSYFMDVRFNNAEAIVALKTACDKEDVAVKETAALAMRIGPYSEQPNLVEAIDFLTPLGELQSVEIVSSQTMAIVEYVSETSIEAVQKFPIFARGVKLLVEQPSVDVS